MSSSKVSRRKFIAFAAGTGAAGVAADCVLIEPMRPHLVRREIILKRWPLQMDAFTIALLSDFHYDPIFSVHPIQTAIRLVNQIAPDLVLLTGDFVTSPMFGDPRGLIGDAEPCAELLSKLRAPYGVWAVLGNHDAVSGPSRVTSALHNVGIQVLTNAAIPVERNGGRFWVAGVGDVLTRSADLRSALRPVPTDEAVVLMAHEPDYADYVARYPVDLQLSGHTHGGQIRLPPFPPVYLPPLGQKYVQGEYRIGGLTLYTTTGLGTIRIPVRLNCPPEVTLITVRRG